MSATNDSVPLEVQGYFPDHTTLQTALARLEDAGFSRGDLSPPEEHPHFGEKAASASGDSLVGETDKAQFRTLGTGMAGYVGAAAVAGATIATGGTAAVALAAAAAVGIGSAAAATGVGHIASEKLETQEDELALEGRLVLGVRTATRENFDKATSIMTAAGASHVQAINRVKDATTAGFSSALWTG